jgi:hypothetical protein
MASPTLNPPDNSPRRAEASLGTGRRHHHRRKRHHRTKRWLGKAGLALVYILAVLLILYFWQAIVADNAGHQPF